jgi:hypothetical protein
MARAVVGGMVVSTVLTLFVIPVLYVSIAGWIDRRRRRRDAAVETEPLAAAASEFSPRRAARAKLDEDARPSTLTPPRPSPAE